jgi:hypothetical protein
MSRNLHATGMPRMKVQQSVICAVIRHSTHRGGNLLTDVFHALAGAMARML